MPSLAERVAARHRLAAFIPDKFFKGYEAQLKAILSKPFAQSYSMREVAFITYDEVVPLLKKFVAELSELAPQAGPTLSERFERRKDMLDMVVKSYDQLRRDVRLEFQHPEKTPRDHVLFHIAIGIDEIISKAIPSLGKAYKVTFKVDPSKVDALIARALKKASPEVLAVFADDDVWASRNLSLKYGFFREHVDKAIPRLIKKEKVNIDWLGWFMFIRDVLAANYAGEPRYSQFDLHGMKVVSDDATITPEQTDKYVKWLDAAYQMLKRKKLGGAWYGTVYIECEKCDGRPGVDGHYNIGKDHVKIFARPSSWVLEVMIHELGHRYYYKSLSSTQREKFKDLVKVNTRPKPNFDGYKPDTLGPDVVKDATKRVESALDNVRSSVREFDKSRLAWFAKIIDKFEEPLAKAAIAFKDEVYTAVQTKGDPSLSAGAKSAWNEFMAAEGVVYKQLFNLRDLSSRVNRHPDGSDWNNVFKTEKSAWIAELEDALNVARSAAEKYVAACVDGYNKKQETLASDTLKEWEAEQDAVVKPVLPVSNYGTTNISEAFAEAFLHYVIGTEMNADQEASFKSVILSKHRMASDVLARWLKAGDLAAPCFTHCFPRPRAPVMVGCFNYERFSLTMMPWSTAATTRGSRQSIGDCPLSERCRFVAENGLDPKNP